MVRPAKPGKSPATRTPNQVDGGNTQNLMIYVDDVEARDPGGHHWRSFSGSQPAAGPDSLLRASAGCFAEHYGAGSRCRTCALVVCRTPSGARSAELARKMGKMSPGRSQRTIPSMMRSKVF
jgi:hypothetical protein